MYAFNVSCIANCTILKCFYSALNLNSHEKLNKTCVNEEVNNTINLPLSFLYVRYIEWVGVRTD